MDSQGILEHCNCRNFLKKEFQIYEAWGQGKDKMTFYEDFHDYSSKAITKEDREVIIH